MRIPLLNTSFVQTPESTVRVPSLRYEGGEALAKGVETLAKGVETFGLNVVDLLNKKKDADDLRIQLDMDMELDNKTLDFEKWKRDHKNANVDDPISTWETYLNDNVIPGIQDRYITNAKVSAQTKYQMESKLNNWKNRMKVSTYADGVARSGEQLKGSLDLMKQKAIASENPSQMDAYSEYLNRGLQTGIIKQEQYDLLLEDATITKQKIGNTKFNNNVQALVDSGNFDAARKTIMDAESNGFISPSEANAQKTRLTYKIEYNNKLEDAQVEADNDPSEFLKKLETTTKNAPQTSDHIEFIKNMEGFVPTSQWDYKQFSVGYGTRGKEGESLTKEEADMRLRTELKSHEDRVDNLSTKFGVMLNPNERAALISYDFNTGRVEGIFNKINSDTSNIPEALRNGIKTADGKVLSGLVNRRNAEADLASSKSLNITPINELSPNDRYKLGEQAKANLARKASEQFRTLKESLDIGQVYNVGALIKTDQFKELQSDDPNVKIMRESLIRYESDVDFKKHVINNGFYQELDNKITDFSLRLSKLSGEKSDQASIEKARQSMKLEEMALFADIEIKTNGEAQTQLKESLRSKTETVEGRRVASITGDSYGLLSKAMNEQKLGTFKIKEPKLINIKDKNRSITQKDIESNTLLIIDGERRVPTESDIGKDTGEDRFVFIQKDPNGFSFLDANGKIQKVKPDQMKDNIVYDEHIDIDKQAEASSKMAKIKDDLAAKIQLGEIKTREQSVDFVKKSIGLTFSPIQTTNSVLNPVPQLNDNKTKLEAARKKLQSIK